MPMSTKCKLYIIFYKTNINPGPNGSNTLSKKRALEKLASGLVPGNPLKL